MHVKIDQIVHFNFGQIIVYQLYLNKADFSN